MRIAPYDNHMYRCIINNIEMPSAKYGSVTVNAVKKEFVFGKETILAGVFVNHLAGCGYEEPEIEVTPNGYQRTIGTKWTPRFSVRLIEDMSEHKDMDRPPVTAGAILEGADSQKRKSSPRGIPVHGNSEDILDIPEPEEGSLPKGKSRARA